MKLVKGRLTKEESTIEAMLDYQTGLDQYYGLVEIAEKYEIFKKVSTRFEMPDGVVEIEIDSDTKQLPTSRTKNLEKEFFLRSNVPQ